LLFVLSLAQAFTPGEEASDSSESPFRGFSAAEAKKRQWWRKVNEAPGRGFYNLMTAQSPQA
jgi:hypothetical protein